jgi:hypothetical protein
MVHSGGRYFVSPHAWQDAEKLIDHARGLWRCVTTPVAKNTNASRRLHNVFLIGSACDFLSVKPLGL